MSTDIQLYGGPLDGLDLAIHADWDDAPLTLRFPVLVPRQAAVLHAVYHREPNPADDGPLWRYVYLEDRVTLPDRDENDDAPPCRPSVCICTNRCRGDRGGCSCGCTHDYLGQ